jgi:hypothetical protein
MKVCVVCKTQDNQDKETRPDEVQTEYKRIEKRPSGGEIFRTQPDWSWGQPSLVYNG